MKTKFYIFIIIFICILALILMQMNNNKELFVTSNYDFDYRKIDRISNGDDNYSYCIGGQITCKKAPLDSLPIEILNLDYFGGKTYKPYCKTDGVEDISNTVYCDGSIFSKLSQSQMPSYKLPKSNFSFPISVEYLGMTQPYSYVPAALDADNRNKLNFIKNQAGDVVEYMDICDVYYQTDQDNCKKALYGSINSSTIIGKAVDLSYIAIDISYNPSIWNNSTYEDDDSYDFMNSSSTGSSSKVTSTTSVSSTGSSTSQSSKIYPPTDCNAKLPCVADFGSEIGDMLCCGQTGVLQNTKNICPSTKPKCTNFDCKTQLGYCQ